MGDTINMSSKYTERYILRDTLTQKYIQRCLEKDIYCKISCKNLIILLPGQNIILQF